MYIPISWGGILPCESVGGLLCCQVLFYLYQWIVYYAARCVPTCISELPTALRGINLLVSVGRLLRCQVFTYLYQWVTYYAARYKPTCFSGLSSSLPGINLVSFCCLLSINQLVSVSCLLHCQVKIPAFELPRKVSEYEI